MTKSSAARDVKASAARDVKSSAARDVKASAARDVKASAARGFKTYIAEKKLPDADMPGFRGKHFDESHYGKLTRGKIVTGIIKTSGDVDIFKPDGSILIRVRRNVIAPEMHQYIYNFFRTKVNKDSHSNNKEFMDKEKKVKFDTGRLKCRSSRSKITGYYDRCILSEIKNFPSWDVCRQTAFTRDHFEEWTSVVPFLEKISGMYRKLAPKEHRRQCKLFDKVPTGLRIGKTPFTTLTSNYNWRTACHVDSGDYRHGMGNLTVLGGKFKGGHVGFPQFKVAINLRPGDVAVMDVHEYHCNTELDADDSRPRMSFVTYFRERMTKCDTKTEYNGETRWYNSDQKDKSYRVKSGKDSKGNDLYVAKPDAKLK